MFLAFFLFIHSPPQHTLYRHIVAVKVTIAKQIPPAKLLLKSGVLFSEGALDLPLPLRPFETAFEPAY